MSPRTPVLVCLLSAVAGLVVALTVALPALADGREVVGLAVLLCSVFGISFGVTGLVVLVRGRNRPRRGGSSS